MAIQRSRPGRYPELAPKKHRISFWTLTVSIDDEGIRTEALTKKRDAWASVTHRSGAYKWGAGNYSSEVTDLFLIRYVPGWEPDPSMTIKWRGREYGIESVENIREENQDVEIRAVRRETVTGGGQ